MASNRSLGCAKHIFIVAALLFLVVAYGLARNWNTFSLMVDNLTIMNEEASEADDLRSPADLVGYLAAYPERASLVAYDVGATQEGIYYRADTVRPVTGIPRLLLLAEFSRQAENDSLNSDSRIALDSVGALALPGISRGAHRQARSRLLEQGSVAADSTITVRDIARSAFQWDDPAAADWLHSHLGRRAVQRIPDRLGLPEVDPPIPTSGMHLLWSNHEQTSSPTAQIDTLAALAASTRTRRAYQALKRLRRDSTFRHRERRRLSQHGSGLSLRHQRTLAKHTAPRGTASAYADILRRVATSRLPSSSIATQMQRHLERTTENDSLGLSVRTVASVGGATPGLISIAGYARQETDAPPRIVVLLLEQLPMAVFYHLLQTSLDKGLFLRLLGKDLLGLRLDPDRASYWDPVEEDGPATRPDKPY